MNCFPVSPTSSQLRYLHPGSGLATLGAAAGAALGQLWASLKLRRGCPFASADAVICYPLHDQNRSFVVARGLDRCHVPVSLGGLQGNKEVAACTQVAGQWKGALTRFFCCFRAELRHLCASQHQSLLFFLPAAQLFASKRESARAGLWDNLAPSILRCVPTLFPSSTNVFLSTPFPPSSILFQR